MEENFSIDEILSAVDEIHTRMRRKKIKITKDNSFQKNISEVPKNTLKLIEEAENN